MNRIKTLVFFLGLVAVATLVYPGASQWIEAVRQAAASQEWEAAAASSGGVFVSEQRDIADRYNESLFRQDPPLVDYLHTLGLPTTDVIGRLIIPGIDLDQPIRHGMGEDALVRGVGHAQESSLPVGGPSTHSVVGGHRGMAQSIGFTRLPEMAVGDTFEVHTLGEQMTYRVISTETLEPLAAAVHPIEEGRDLFTLLTCTPLGVNSHRFVVTAERVLDPEGSLAPVEVEAAGFPWWMLYLLGGIAASGGLARVSGPRRTRVVHRADSPAHSSRETYFHVEG